MEKFYCRECDRGPSSWADWAFDIMRGVIYCPSCLQVPMLVQDDPAPVGESFPVELGGEA